MKSPNVDHFPSVVRDDTMARLGPDADLSPTGFGPSTTIAVVGVVAEVEAPILYLNLVKAGRRGASLVTVGGRSTKLDHHARACLRYRYGAQDSLFAALIDEVRSMSGGPAAETLDATRHNPIRRRDLHIAAEAIVGAKDLVIVYGQEALRLGLLPALESLLEGGGDGPGSGGLIAVGAEANSQGAADMGLLPGWLPGYRKVSDAAAISALADTWPNRPPTAVGLDAKAMLEGGVKGLALLEVDPVGADPRLERSLRALDALVVLSSHRTATTDAATVVLPVQVPAERDGTFTSFARRIQHFTAAIPPAGGSRPAWSALDELGRQLGSADRFASASDVFHEIMGVVRGYEPQDGAGRAGLSSDPAGKLPTARPGDLIVPFAPWSFDRDVTYEGTCRENRVGEGWVWPVAGRSPAAFYWRPDVVEPPEGLVLVPTSVLYDNSPSVRRSAVLGRQVPEPYVVMSHFDAPGLGLADRANVVVTGESGTLKCRLRLMGRVTPGVVLAPLGLDWETPPQVLLGDAPWVRVSVELDDTQDG
jgi:predicted molibdopterin-dependent oxidoreductase YjgC